ncbi:hypothetical protein BCR42DRAFT_491062 [Absidia repens]|uniref:Uncharacterized protein n=1 Tax=Absidia repens TaxID=90262 RepID=A0A1X2IK36_9FUNG|nr:hypothetical protein BCR42DRAFT_491062 [Absidia repens]
MYKYQFWRIIVLALGMMVLTNGSVSVSYQKKNPHPFLHLLDFGQPSTIIYWLGNKAKRQKYISPIINYYGLIHTMKAKSIKVPKSNNVTMAGYIDDRRIYEKLIFHIGLPTQLL